MKENEQPQVTDEYLKEADRIWEDPQKVMHLIDLIFLFDDPDKEKMFS